MRLRRFFNALILLIVCVAIGRTAQMQLALSERIGNAHATDAGSEWAAVNSGMHYYKLGFLNYAGLPDLSYPSNKWYTDPNDEPSGKDVYTHYPPGPNWMAGIGIHLCGPNQFACYRRIPIVVGVLCLILSYLFVAGAVGAILAASFILVLLQVPMTVNMMHGLHYQGYAFSLFLLQMSLAWYALSTDALIRKRYLMALFFLSFLQGWLSFDYFFISTLFPVPIAYICITRPTNRSLFKVTCASLIGFLCAMFMHVCQIAIYCASGTRDAIWNFQLSSLPRGFSCALGDLAQSASYRSTGVVQAPVPNTAFFDAMYRYIVELAPSDSQAGQVGVFIVGAALISSLALLVTRGFCGGSLRSWLNGARGIFSLILALVITLLWVVVMRNHALDGTHMTFIPRHFILVIWVSGALVVSTMSLVIRAFVTYVKGRKGSFFRLKGKNSGTVVAMSR